MSPKRDMVVLQKKDQSSLFETIVKLLSIIQVTLVIN